MTKPPSSLMVQPPDTVPDVRPPRGLASLSKESSGGVPLWRSAVLLMLTVLMVVIYWINPPLDIVARPGVVMQLPLLVGDYFGREGEITTVERNILPADTEYARRFYADTHGHEIECSIILSGSEQRSIHRPEACLVGQGWTIVGQQNVPLTLNSGHQLVMRKLSLERQVVMQSGAHLTLRAFYEYWFVGQNVTTPSHFTRILLSNWDRVMHNRAHRWAYVSMFADITDNVTPGGYTADQTQQAIADFTRQIVPTFQIDEMPPQAAN